jgi:hypothetical protein
MTSIIDFLFGVILTFITMIIIFWWNDRQYEFIKE